MTSELKPCPFCGDSKHLIIDDCLVPEMKGYFGFNVICNAAGWDGAKRGCGAVGAWGETKEEAVKVWNTRAVPDVPELVRYYAVSGGNMMKHDNGLYVLYSQATAIIAAVQEELALAVSDEDKGAWRFWSKKSRELAENNKELRERAEAAEAKLHTADNTIADIANELGCKPYNEEILQTIFDMKSKLAEYEGKNERSAKN